MRFQLTDELRQVLQASPQSTFITVDVERLADSLFATNLLSGISSMFRKSLKEVNMHSWYDLVTWI